MCLFFLRLAYGEKFFDPGTFLVALPAENGDKEVDRAGGDEAGPEAVDLKNAAKAGTFADIP